MDKKEIIDQITPSFCALGKITRSQRIINSIFRKHIAPYELSNSQLSILFIITKIEGVTQKKIGEILFMEKSTVQRNLQRLFKRDLIISEGKKIMVSDGGFKLLSQVIPAWKTALQETNSRLGTDGSDGLDLVLTKLISSS